MVKKKPTAPPKEPKKTGAPSYKWTPEIEDEILDRIAKGEPTRKICLDPWLPSWPTLNKRLANDPQFVARYVCARETQADAIFDEILQIADDATNDYMRNQNGGLVPDQEHIQRSRLRIEARKWMAAKLRPKVYGDRVDLTHSDPDGGPVQFRTVIESPPLGSDGDL